MTTPISPPDDPDALTECVLLLKARWREHLAAQVHCHVPGCGMAIGLRDERCEECGERVSRDAFEAAMQGCEDCGRERCDGTLAACVERRV